MGQIITEYWKIKRVKTPDEAVRSTLWRKATETRHTIFTLKNTHKYSAYNFMGFLSIEKI
jgi:hypothetical protein